MSVAVSALATAYARLRACPVYEGPIRLPLRVKTTDPAMSWCVAESFTAFLVFRPFPITLATLMGTALEEW